MAFGFVSDWLHRCFDLILCYLVNLFCFCHWSNVENINAEIIFIRQIRSFSSKKNRDSSLRKWSKSVVVCDCWLSEHTPSHRSFTKLQSLVNLWKVGKNFNMSLTSIKCSYNDSMGLFGVYFQDTIPGIFSRGCFLFLSVHNLCVHLCSLQEIKIISKELFSRIHLVFWIRKTKYAS